jgi:Asp-tRNA(Asn)/Glu-tRNA(Gln) amidotransferase C subunit
VLPEEEAGLQKDFENILGLLDKLSEVDTSSVVL